MRLGVVSWLWQREPLERALADARRLGIHDMEVGTAGFFEKVHCDPEHLSTDDAERSRFRTAFEEHEVSISALAVHGEPLHPDPAIAEPYLRQLRATIVLASQLGVRNVTLLSGLPGAGPEDRHPNWVLYPYPAKALELIEWQWNERLLPYWTEQGAFAREHGVRLCFEIHPADMCYQPSRLMRLRADIGEVVGANLDPSHLIWQGMDVADVVYYLGDAVYSVHAKESEVNQRVARIDGVLETRDWDREGERGWNFRTAGWSKSATWWRGVITALQATGFDGVLSYEHEDALLDPIEGLERGLSFLRESVLALPRAKLWYM